jgi:hypothetical protein
LASTCGCLLARVRLPKRRLCLPVSGGLIITTCLASVPVPTVAVESVTNVVAALPLTWSAAWVG